MSALAEQFARFADLFPEPILLVSNGGHLCAANRGAQEQLLQSSTITTDDLVSEFVEDTSEKIATYLRDCSRSAQPLPGLFRFRTQGSVVAFHCHGSAFRDRDSQDRPLVVLRFSAKEASSSRFAALNLQIDQLRNEIARRLNAERMADNQRQLWQVTLSSIGDAVIATDMAGGITFMNPVAEAHLACQFEQCAGQSVEEVFIIRDERTGAPLENPVRQVIRTGRTVTLANHTVLVRTDGTELPIDDSAAPIRDGAGTLRGVILVFHEISESRRLQRELLQQADALKEADARKDQFLAVLAHELRNPLSPLRNGLQIARMKIPADDVLRRTIEMMERQLEHMVRLVDDLMDVNRVSRGAIELRRAPVFIADVLARSAEAVRGDMEARGHRFHLEADGQGIAVMGDADRLAQVFSNLLTNSSKYSPNGGEILMRVVVDNDDVVVRVTDRGIGIPADQLERVFDMFSQVRLHQDRSEGGLGIGLSLVQTIVQMHGGSIVASSGGLGSGSTFTVRLPLLQHSTAEQIQTSPATTSSGQALRVVVADDNIDSAHTLCVLLEAEGHEVRLAATGREAVQQVAEFKPNIVFMDVGMSDMDGVEATRHIREHSDGQRIDIVALTGWGQPKDRERTRLAGADRHVVKPIGPEELSEVLQLARQGVLTNSR